MQEIKKSKKQIDLENQLIKAWKPLFDEFPNLNHLPVYSWGRYYKYECAGSPFESYVSEYGFIKNGWQLEQFIDINLLEEIEEKHNQPNGKIWNGEIGDYLPDRKECVDFYNFDDRAGKCLVIERKGNELIVNVYNCDSPE